MAAKKVEFFSGPPESKHLAFMEMELVYPEPDEYPFMYPKFTELTDPDYPEEWFLKLVTELEVLDDNGDVVVWDEEDYLDWMIREFRPGALSAYVVE